MRRPFNIFRRLERLETRTIFRPFDSAPDPERTKLVLDLVNDIIAHPWNAHETDFNTVEEVTRIRIDRLRGGFSWAGKPRPERLTECAPSKGYEDWPCREAYQGVQDTNPSGGRDTAQHGRRRGEE